MPNSTTHPLYTVLCVHHPGSSLLPSPFIPLYPPPPLGNQRYPIFLFAKSGNPRSNMKAFGVGTPGPPSMALGDFPASLSASAPGPQLCSKQVESRLRPTRSLPSAILTFANCSPSGQKDNIYIVSPHGDILPILHSSS